MKFLIWILLAGCAVSALTNGNLPRIDSGGYDGSTTPRG
jgi:hypothetical protein